MQTKLELNNQDINQAIVDYVTAKGIATQGKSVSVTIKAGRKGNGNTAEVVIDDAVAAAAVIVEAAEEQLELYLEEPQEETVEPVEVEVEGTTEPVEKTSSLFD